MPNAPAPPTAARGPSDRPILKMTGVSKRFPGVQALEDVHLEVGQAEIHALLGENGAGKSTLLKVLSGAHSADAGEIELYGEPVAFATPHDAQRAGVVTIYQEFTLAPDMTIAENVFIGREPGSRLFISWRRLSEDDPRDHRQDRPQARPDDAGARSFGRRAAARRDRSRALHALAAHRHGRADIGAERSGSRQSRRIIRTLKAEGLSIIFVTHRLEEVFRLCDRFTVLRDGRYVGSGAVADVNCRRDHPHDGRARRRRALRRAADPRAWAVALEVEGLTRRRNARDPHAIELVDVSLRAHKGEILGLAGLVGAGRTETARAIFGADKFDHGVIRIDGKDGQFRRARAMRCGTASAWRRRTARSRRCSCASPSARTSPSPAQDQISRGWFIDEGREAAVVDEFRRLLSIRMASPDQLAGLLSGGNQQKVVLARWLALRPKILIVDEPTRGIDVGSKVEVHNLLIEMAKSGIAVIVISSELPEILAVSDRIVTMREGRVTGEIARNDATQEILMSMMTFHDGAGEAAFAA